MDTPTPKDTILVGKKPPMSYVMAVITQFHSGASEVHVKARGKAISCAVDVVEIVRNRFLNDVKLGPIALATESLKSQSGQQVNVSSIDIVLLK